jgi:hypothetical protein
MRDSGVAWHPSEDGRSGSLRPVGATLSARAPSLRPLAWSSLAQTIKPAEHVSRTRCWGTIAADMGQDLDAFVAKWAASGAAERANKDSFLNELCDVLGVVRPEPTRNDPERDAYVFERKVPLVHEDGDATLGSIDLYVVAAFKGAKKADVEDVLDSLAALGLLAAFETRKTRRWKSTRAGA